MRSLFLPILVATTASFAAASADAPMEDTFLAGTRAAMATMMTGMEIRPSGDVDRDFVAMMVPHHQGAIDMAVALLHYGHNARLKLEFRDAIRITDISPSLELRILSRYFLSSVRARCAHTLDHGQSSTRATSRALDWRNRTNVRSERW
jgi:hypothetical protein